MWLVTVRTSPINMLLKEGIMIINIYNKNIDPALSEKHKERNNRAGSTIGGHEYLEKELNDTISH